MGRTVPYRSTSLTVIEERGSWRGNVRGRFAGVWQGRRQRWSEATTMGSGDWYHARGGQHVGPVSLGELAQRLHAGEVGSDDLVWREGMPDWQPARTVSELAGALPAGPAAAALPGLSPSGPAQPAW